MSRPVIPISGSASTRRPASGLGVGLAGSPALSGQRPAAVPPRVPPAGWAAEYDMGAAARPPPARPAPPAARRRSGGDVVEVDLFDDAAPDAAARKQRMERFQQMREKRARAMDESRPASCHRAFFLPVFTGRRRPRGHHPVPGSLLVENTGGGGSRRSTTRRSAPAASRTTPTPRSQRRRNARARRPSGAAGSATRRRWRTRCSRSASRGRTARTASRRRSRA